jgi:hypothetical protein
LKSQLKEVEVVKVKCIKEYYDRLLKKIIKVDEELEVTEERANQLIVANVAVATTTTTEKVAKTRKKKEV